MIEINKNYNENCLTTMSNMNDEFWDLCITSPPYDSARKYNGYSFEFELIAKELYRTCKSGGVLVWVVNDQTKGGTETGTSFRQCLYFKEIGFNIHDTMIFAKNNPPPLTHNRYDPAFEFMFVFSKNKPKTFNPILEPTMQAGKTYNRKCGNKANGEENYITRIRDEELKVKELKYRKNIWYYSVGHGDTGTHPAPFPEDLAKDHIISWSNENEIIYDPFMGSGTTAKMAKILKRNYIGSELSEAYHKEAAERLNNVRLE